MTDKKRDSTTSPPRLIRPRTVTELTSLSRSTIDRLIKNGAFPLPVQIGERRIAWRETEVIAWITSRQVAEWAA